MKTYLFDFDGTLVDSMPTFVSSMLRILDENNIKYEEDIIKVITPLGLEGTADYFVKIGVPLSKKEIMLLMKKYILDAYLNDIQAKDNVISVLKYLKEQNVSLNILTASPHITLDACLKRLDMFSLFDNVWSCDDFSTTKADPEIYKNAAKRLSVNVCDVLFLDDNLNANKTAKSAGMRTCGVYDDSSRDYVEDIKSVTDYYIYDFSELLEIEF